MIAVLAVLFGLLALFLVARATHTITLTWQKGSETLTKSVAYTYPAEKNLDLTIPTGTTNKFIAVAWVTANLKSYYLVSDQNVTIKTNSSGTPQETINLVAGNPITFRFDDGRGALFAGSVTGLYVSNASGATAAITQRALEDIP